MSRGDYRPIFVALLDGPQFLVLTKWARALFYPLKLKLGPLGIAAIPGAVGVFSDLTAMTYAEVEEARAELVAGLWLRIEGNVWWLVRGLEFEPQLDPKNHNHLTFVRREWQKLPNLAIRAEFAAAYRLWFVGMDKAIDRASEGPSNAPQITNPIQNQPDTNPTTSTARAKLVADLFVDPAELEAVAGFLTRFTVDDANAWASRLRAYLKGIDFPGGKKATSAAIATACRDLNPSEAANPARFRRFVERAMTDAANPIGERRETSSEDAFVRAAKKAEAKHAPR